MLCVRACEFKHFIHERRAIPRNLSLILDDQLRHHHDNAPPVANDATDAVAFGYGDDDDDMQNDGTLSDCSRRYCYGVKPSDRCRVGCCKARFCCSDQPVCRH